MKRSEMEHRLRLKLIKQKHLFYTFKDKPKNMPFEILISLIAGRCLTEIEEAGMLPPRVESTYKKWGFNPYIENNYWEPEDEVD